MKKIFFVLIMIFALFMAYTQEEKVFSIAVLPIYNLSYNENQQDLDDTLSSITQEIKKNAGYKVIEGDDVIKALKRKKISIDSILLESDLINIINKLEVDFVFYNIISLNEKKIVTIYSKAVNQDNEVITVEKTVRNIKSVKNYFKASIVEAVSQIESETKIKLDLPKINLSDLTLTNKIGILSIGTGAFMFAGGLALFIFDTAYYSTLVIQAKNDYTSFNIPYTDYLNLYNENIAFFSAGVALMSLGIISASVGIPLFFHKENKNKVSFDVQFGKTLTFALNYKLDINYNQGVLK